jgi:very-short-patch-repair endonuclease
MPEKIFNRRPLKQFRKDLRNNLTPAEAVLWTYLQKKQLDGKKFRRQHSIGNYIVDFYCPAEKLAVELDGAGHFTPEEEEHDLDRDKYLMALGIKVLRYENRDIWNNIEAVLDDIKKNFKPPRSCST